MKRRRLLAPCAASASSPARAGNVRAALLPVEHGEMPRGIVYAPDAVAPDAALLGRSLGFSVRE